MESGFRSFHCGCSCWCFKIITFNYYLSSGCCFRNSFSVILGSILARFNLSSSSKVKLSESSIILLILSLSNINSYLSHPAPPMSAVPAPFLMKISLLHTSFCSVKKQTKRTTNSDELKRTHPTGVRSVRISSVFFLPLQTFHLRSPQPETSGQTKAPSFHSHMPPMHILPAAPDSSNYFCIELLQIPAPPSPDAWGGSNKLIQSFPNTFLQAAAL
jgi:hypothetical protein